MRHSFTHTTINIRVLKIINEILSMQFFSSCPMQNILNIYMCKNPSTWKLDTHYTWISNPKPHWDMEKSCAKENH